MMPQVWAPVMTLTSGQCLVGAKGSVVFKYE